MKHLHRLRSKAGLLLLTVGLTVGAIGSVAPPASAHTSSWCGHGTKTDFVIGGTVPGPWTVFYNSGVWYQVFSTTYAHHHYTTHEYAYASGHPYPGEVWGCTS
jgi:hypothetical protein